jgi:hypothetical protein
VDASFSALVADKAVSITVVHGDVSLTVPADARANVQLRTLRGEMLTNFGEDALKTRMEDNASDDAEAQNAESMAKVEAERARRQAEQDRKQAERDRKEAEKRAVEAAARANGSKPPTMAGVPMPPMPPMPAMPPITSGKLVVGTLNGGGTEVTVATITGDITLQKAD